MEVKGTLHISASSLSTQSATPKPEIKRKLDSGDAVKISLQRAAPTAAPAAGGSSGGSSGSIIVSGGGSETGEGGQVS